MAPTQPARDLGSPETPSTHPALHPSVTNVPVTPAVHMHSSFGRSSPNDDLSPGSEEGHLGGQHTADSYFTCKEERPLSSTEQAAAGARSPEELLRRLSLAQGTSSNPKTTYNDLHLSGNVISAHFCVPYTLAMSLGGGWELKRRRGTSALNDSFAYLASDASDWHHTLVGWTGEIQPARDSAFNPAAARSKASAPIPVDGMPVFFDPSAGSDVRVVHRNKDLLEKQLGHDHHGKIVPVWLTEEQDEEQGAFVLKDQSKWRTYAENELYTLFHYKQNTPTDGHEARRDWALYFRMNKLFADKIVDVHKPGDIILIHDFYLLLVPSLLRQRLPDAYIGFFLHVPFPSSEVYRCLSRRKEILEGMLGANLIGFQSFSYSRHFTSCCSRILGFGSSSVGVDAYGAHVGVDVFPIGIDAAATERQAFHEPSVTEQTTRIRELYADKKIIIGRDRLDTVRGITQKLQAFDVFLEKYPEWRQKVVLIQVTSPSIAQSVGEDNSKVMNKLSDLASKTNGVYGSVSFSPVQHFPQYLSQDEYHALLRVADVGLITSVRDGMNTTSLEYIICQKENFGPLILSEFSGTAGSLSSAIHINPWNLSGVADSINQALTMSMEERQKNHSALYQHVTLNNVQAWTNKLLKRLLTTLSSHGPSLTTPVLDRVNLLAQYRTAKRRLFMFDYDGTLTPIVQDPPSAIPSDRVVRTLKTLASDPANSVWIISGRDQAFLEEWMGHITELGLSAEHGSFMRHPGSDTWVNLAEQVDMGWQAEVLDVFQHYTEQTPGG